MTTTTTTNNTDGIGSGVVIGSGNNPFGDTTLTKVFVGGLAWETPRETMKEHFDKYGEILEAVVISDKLTGRSKGYGFVTFKDPEAAKKACEDATPMINGRRANCNLASLGARRAKSSPPPQGIAGATVPNATAHAPAAHPSPPFPHQGSNVVGLRTIPTTAAANPQVQWYYPAATTPLPFHHQAIPFFGYSPAYIAADVTYNQKLSYNGGGGGGAGGYMNAHYAHHRRQVYPSQTMLHAANTLVPMYPHHQHHHPPLYHHHHPYHQGHTTMGLPAHIFPTTTTTTSGGAISAVPAILSKTASIPPPPTNSVCLAVE